MQDQDAKDAKADLAHDAIASPGRPGASFEVFGKVQDAGAFVSIERPAVLARIHDEARTAAITSHADVSQGWLESSRKASRESLLFGDESARKELPRTFQRISAKQARSQAGFLLSTPYATSLSSRFPQLTHMAQAVLIREPAQAGRPGRAINPRAAKS
jgi:hypothetical protein